MRYYYDLHIHSGLSPCANNSMSPNNIINMSLLKGLNIISITDHNSARNINTILEVSKDKDLLVVPGIEVETIEGIHLVCYFKTHKNLLDFEQVISESLPNLTNNERIFGEQLLYDKEDCQIGKIEKMLLNSCSLRINEVIDLTHHHHGIVSLAHVNRVKNSIMTVLGFIPNNLRYDLIELTNNQEGFIKRNNLNPAQIIYNSDAHQLGDISEAINSIELKELTIESLFCYFKR